MLELDMDTGEIIREYKAAKNPREMITVLADRNGVSKRDMVKWLIDHDQQVDARLTGQKTTEPGAKPIHVYVAGKITGNAIYREEFGAVCAWLSDLGFVAINPAENDTKDGKYKYYIDTGLKQLMKCQAICLMPNWTDSHGAILERTYAETVGLPFIDIPSGVWRQMTKSIVEAKNAEREN